MSPALTDLNIAFFQQELRIKAIDTTAPDVRQDAAHPVPKRVFRQGRCGDCRKRTKQSRPYCAECSGKRMRGIPTYHAAIGGRIFR